jgi:hypothetical protein
MSSETVLYAALTAAPAVTSKTVDRIYPDVVPQDIKGAAVAYSRLSTEPVTTIHNGIPLGLFTTLDVWCMAASRVDAESLCDACQTTLGAANFLILDRRAEFDDANELWAAVLTVRHFST